MKLIRGVFEIERMKPRVWRVTKLGKTENITLSVTADTLKMILKDFRKRIEVTNV